MRGKALLLIIFFPIVFLSSLFAQEGIVSGVMKDKSGDPLPGVSISVEGKSIGTQTDFDGIYAISCSVGDVLVISYVGFKTRKVTVTSKMIEDSGRRRGTVSLKSNEDIPVPKDKVKHIESSDYSKLLKRKSIIDVSDKMSHQVEDRKQSYWFDLDRLKKISVGKDKVYLMHYKEDFYYGFNINQATAFKFVSDINELSSTSLFEDVHKTNTNLSFDVGNNEHHLNLNVSDTRQKSFFSKGKEKQNLWATKYKWNLPKHELDVEIRRATEKNTQPNINGFNNKVIRLGVLAEDRGERTKPFIITNNRNQFESGSLLTSIKDKWTPSNNWTLIPSISYQTYRKEYRNEFPVGVGGSDILNAYSSKKEIEEGIFQLGLNTRFEKGKFEIVNVLDFNSYQIDYVFQEADRVIEQNLFNDSRRISEDLQRFHMFNKLKYEFNNELTGNVSLGNHTDYSSIQGSSIFQPVFTGYVKFNNVIYDVIEQVSLGINASKTSNVDDLLYSNASHSSLRYNIQNSIGYTANDELFIDNSIKLSTIKNYSGTLGFGLFQNKVSLSGTYFESNIDDSVFAILEEDRFQLLNLADIKKQGFEATLTYNHYSWRGEDFNFSSALRFSSYQARVKGLANNQQRISISGFSDVSKQLIVGESVGVIVGSAYIRNSLGQKVFSSGSPLVEENVIIGDPIPDINMTLSSDFEFFRRINLSFAFEWQQGGEVWDGSRKLQEAQQLDSLTGLVDEDFIEDATYINLSSVQLDYSPKLQKAFFDNMKFSVYGKNLWTYTSFKGATPFSDFLEGTNTQGLQFFNSPIVSEVGIRMELKFR